MSIVLEATGASGSVQRIPLSGGANSVRALPGLKYRLVDSEGGRVAETALVKRIGDDLVVEGLADGASVSLEGFFTRCAPGDACSLSMENIGGSAAETILPSTQPVAALSEGGFLMYASGAAAPPLPTAPEAETDYKPALAGLAGLAIVGGGGGGGGDTSSDTTPPPAPVITSGTYTNKTKPVIAGTAEVGSTVTVTLDAGSDGTSDVSYSVLTDSSGLWSVDTATAAPISGVLPALAEGVPTEIRALARDAAGNASGVTVGSLILDTIAPGQPTITSALLTNDPTPRIGGAADAGSIVTVGVDLDRNGSIDVSWRTVATALGTYSVDLGNTPASGTLPGGALGDVSTTDLIVVASDLAGNVSSPATAVLNVDTRLPDAPLINTIAGDNAINALEAASSITISGTISEADRPVTVQWGSLAARAATVTGTTWTITFTPSELAEPLFSDGLQTVTVTYVGAAGSTSVAGTQDVLIDRVAPGAPTVALNPISDTGALGDGITSDDTPTIRVTLTATGAAAGDAVTLFSGATAVGTALLDASDISAGFVDLVPASLGADGVKTLTATITDAVGNVSGASAAIQLTIDRTAPTLAITDDAPGTATGPVTFTFTFSEPVSGFDASDVVVGGGTKGAFTAVSATVYRLVVTPTPDTDGQITVDVPAGAAVDVAGTPNVAAPQAVQPYTLAVAPALTITDNVPGTATGPITYTFTFSEPVTGFDANDVAISAGTKGAFTAVSTSVYTLVVNPPANSTGTIAVSVAAGAANDLSGNPSLAASASAQPFDTAAPALVITDNVAGTATGPVTYTFSFSEPVNGFTADDVAVTGGSKGTLSGSGSTYTLVVTPPADTTGTIAVSVAAGVAADLAGNPNTAAVADPQAFDTAVAPSLTIADNVPGTATGPVTYTFSFSEPVNGFTADDVTVTGGGTKGAFGGSGSTYTLVVTPPADTSGTIGVSVAAGVAADLSGNPNTAAVADPQPFNTAVAPSLAITDDVTSTAAGPVTYTFSFSEPVNGFTADDVTVTVTGGGTKGAFGGSGSTYTLVVTPPADTSGTIGVSVAAGVAADLSGNPNTAAAADPQPFNTAVAPSLAITDDVTGTAAGPVTYTFSFSEPVNGFTADDVTVTGGGTKGAFGGSGSTYTLVVTPPADTTGTIGVSVAAGVAADPSGNPNTAAVADPQPFDTAAPTVAITDVVDDFGIDTGSLVSGGTTDDSTPTLTIGFGEVFDANHTVEILRNGSVIQTLAPTGTTSAEFTDQLLVDDSYTYTARMTDAAGNVGTSGSFLLIFESPPLP